MCCDAGGGAYALGVAKVVNAGDEEWPHGEWELAGFERGADVGAEVAVGALDRVLVVGVRRCVREGELVVQAPELKIVRAKRLMPVRNDLLDDMAVELEVREKDTGEVYGFFGVAGACWCGDNELGGEARGA